jgi:hypothetical protein
MTGVTLSSDDDEKDAAFGLGQIGVIGCIFLE